MTVKVTQLAGDSVRPDQSVLLPAHLLLPALTAALSLQRGPQGGGRDGTGEGRQGTKQKQEEETITDCGPTPAVVRASLRLVTSIPRSSAGPTLHEHTRGQEETHISNTRALPNENRTEVRTGPCRPPGAASPARPARCTGWHVRNGDEDSSKKSLFL